MVMANDKANEANLRPSWGAWSATAAGRASHSGFYGAVRDAAWGHLLFHCHHDHPTRREAIACAAHEVASRPPVKAARVVARSDEVPF